MITVRNWVVYGMLAALWGALLAWQTWDHFRVSKSLHDGLIQEGRVRAGTCARLMNSRRFASSAVNKERLEAALNALVDTNQFIAVQLLNKSDKVVASAGRTNEIPPGNEFEGGVYWTSNVAVMRYPIDLINLTNSEPELVVPEEDLRSMRTNRLAAESNNPAPPSSTSSNAPSRRFVNLAKERPYWMKPEVYDAIMANDTVHTFVVAMSAQAALASEYGDLWLRLVIGLLGAVAAAGFAAAWRGMVGTSELQLRLVRASEQNLHLKELNLAAAGLAHETRNPLNIIRGLAQLIAKQEGAPPEIAAKSREIINETDRVTAQLNEFINYSRPREVRRAATNLSAVAAEVARALDFDIKEKKINLEVLVESVVIEADEQLLRQALFNLVINAIQAVPLKGAIRIRASRRSNEEAFIEVSDDGPGVPPENRSEIFKPYFTTHAEGTGLGLSVVQQIVLAHGWEIQCLPNEPAGALFRISHVKLKVKE